MLALRLFPPELDRTRLKRAGTSNGTDKAGDGPGEDRSHHHGRRALWLHTGGCRFGMSALSCQGLVRGLGGCYVTSRCALPMCK